MKDPLCCQVTDTVYIYHDAGCREKEEGSFVTEHSTVIVKHKPRGKERRGKKKGCFVDVGRRRDINWNGDRVRASNHRDVVNTRPEERYKNYPWYSQHYLPDKMFLRRWEKETGAKAFTERKHGLQNILGSHALAA